MNQSAYKFATYEDLFDLPEHIIGEIIAGQLITQPRPSPKHALAGSSLGMSVGASYHRGQGGPGGWWILFEPELHLGSDILVPDLAGWRRTRMPVLPKTAYFEIAPDWVCEVLSPSTARIDRVQKMPLYAQNQVAYLWLIDPELRTLEAYLLRDGHWSLETALKDDEAVCVPPFDGVSFSLGGLWAGED